ncbi:MAG: 3-keto-5-aminohexanoate cleavage protein, partial [Candidatus Bathyarchaeia archaeon]
AEWPVHLEPKNPTMDKKLIIIVCPTGALIDRNQNPTQPYTPEEIAQEVIEAYNEGACYAHIHCRDQRGYPTYAPEVLKKTLDLIFDECPDILAAPSTAHGHPRVGDISKSYDFERLKALVKELLSYGRKYIRGTVFTPVSYTWKNRFTRATEENMVAAVKYYQSVGVKPEFMAHSFEALKNVNEWLITPGILEKPYFITMAPGMHHTGYTHPDPWGLMWLINMRYMLPPDILIGASCGGHNWLPLATLAIMLGCDAIRVGKEDTMWLYPHKDEILKKNAEAVRKIATIAKELGRDIATPDEAKEILGITD